ncbi:gamma-glutamyltransferase family protein [Halovulum sp. GXIMD14793]
MRDFHQPGRSVVLAVNGMAATSHPLASKVAVQTLEQGGNAVDAVLAAAVLLGICEPQMTGIGGDCFALIRPASEDRIVGLNASGRAPAGLDPAKLRAAHKVMPTHTADAVTVPGAVAGFVKLSQDWGKLGLKTALAPAIHYAEQGIPVAPRVAFDWANSVDALQGAARQDFLFAGKAPSPGTIFRSPKQAEALRRIAMDGHAGFYEGAVAEDMVAALTAVGGCHTLEDFATSTAEYVEPIIGQYRGHELIELPPNGQGAIAVLMANMMAEFDLAALDPAGAERAHLEAEIAKLAYDTRDRFVADAANAAPYLDHMVSPQTARDLAALIDPGKALASPAAASEAIHKDTVYLCVVDSSGMAVSLIYSIFHSFGSGLMSPEFGILLHNRGAGFSLSEGHPNEAGPGKRPMHTIIPAMLRKPGEFLMPFGVMGGQYQACGHARFLSNVVDYGMDVQQAITLPRSFAYDGVLQLERGYDTAAHTALAQKGHRVETPDTAIGGAQAIHLDLTTGVMTGGSDPRKDGCALGF